MRSRNVPCFVTGAHDARSTQINVDCNKCAPCVSMCMRSQTVHRILPLTAINPSGRRLSQPPVRNRTHRTNQPTNQPNQPNNKTTLPSTQSYRTKTHQTRVPHCPCPSTDSNLLRRNSLYTNIMLRACVCVSVCYLSKAIRCDRIGVCVAHTRTNRLELDLSFYHTHATRHPHMP